LIGRERWAPPTRAANFGLAALLSFALHGAVLGGTLLWLHREPPPEPANDRGVEIVWDESANEAVSTAETAQTPGVPPGAEAPEMTEAAQPPAPPPSPPMAAPPPAPVPLPVPVPLPLAMAAAPPVAPPPPPAPPLDVPPTELRAPDLAVAPPPAFETPASESPPEAALPDEAPPPPQEAAQPDTAPLPLPPPAPPEPPREPARARPTPPRPAAPRAPEGARPGPDAAQQALAGLGRATGAVVPPGPDARFQNAAPSYPEAARLRGEQGSVALELSVGADGRVITVGVTRSSGSPMLDAAARRTVADWRFRAATRDGEAVPGTIRTTVHFRLQ